MWKELHDFGPPLGAPWWLSVEDLEELSVFAIVEQPAFFLVYPFNLWMSSPSSRIGSQDVLRFSP